MRKRGQEFVFEAARLFGDLKPRELRFLAAGHHHADAGHPDWSLAIELDAPLALAPAHRAVRGHDPILDVVRNRMLERLLDRREHAFPIVWVDFPLVTCESSVEASRRKS